MSKGINFTCIQISDYFQIMEKAGMEVDCLDDAEASTMFNTLLIEMYRSLDEDQAQTLSDSV